MAQDVLCYKKIRNAKAQSKRYIYYTMHAHAPEATPRPGMLVRPRESSAVLVLDAVSADGCRGHEGAGSRRCCCCGGCCRIRPRRWPPLAAARCCTNASTPVLPNHSGVAARRAAALARLALVMAWIYLKSDERIRMFVAIFNSPCWSRQCANAVHRSRCVVTDGKTLSGPDCHLTSKPRKRARRWPDARSTTSTCHAAEI